MLVSFSAVFTEYGQRFNELVVKAHAELDQTKPAAKYKETQELIRDDGSALVPMLANYVMGIST